MDTNLIVPFTLISLNLFQNLTLTYENGAQKIPVELFDP